MNKRKLFRFNLNKLNKLSNNNPIKLVNILHKYYQKSNINLIGYSYLLNPKKFFLDHSTDILYKAQYIQLAGHRSYQQYKDLNHTYLDLSYYPDLNINTIIFNPILTIKQNKIYFKYEEANDINI
jgi:hypothetical protein